MAEAALNVGFYISLSGVITFKNAKDLVDIVKYIPTDKLLVETDSPYLSPVPNRGKRNEPSNTKFTLEKLAEIKSTSVENMAKITTDNFFSLFKEI
jgi:TatD DNase family protein